MEGTTYNAQYRSIECVCRALHLICSIGQPSAVLRGSILVLPSAARVLQADSFSVERRVAPVLKSAGEYEQSKHARRGPEGEQYWCGEGESERGKI